MGTSTHQNGLGTNASKRKPTQPNPTQPNPTRAKPEPPRPGPVRGRARGGTATQPGGAGRGACSQQHGPWEGTSHLPWKTWPSRNARGARDPRSGGRARRARARPDRGTRTGRAPGSGWRWRVPHQVPPCKEQPCCKMMRAPLSAPRCAHARSASNRATRAGLRWVGAPRFLATSKYSGCSQPLDVW